MYDKRIKTLVILSSLFLLLCVLRLTQMQLLPNSLLQDEIADLKRQRGQSLQLKTVRGRLLDRKARVLAADEPRFQLCISYELSSIFDERVRKVELLRAAIKSQQPGTNISIPEVRKAQQARLDDLLRIIDKCTHFGPEQTEIENKIKIENTIKKRNDWVWNLRTYLAWKRDYPNQDFEKAVPDSNTRLLLAAKVNIAEMYQSRPLIELRTDDDIFTAQLEFMDVEGIQILPKAHRFYHYRTVAAQTIGWVAPATLEIDKELFDPNDKLSKYLSGEVSGREDGVEFVCESILRGRRGELIYNIDRQLVSQTETRFGKDVRLTLDIELQKRLEEYLADSDLNPNYEAPTAAVVLDVATGDILALVSMPVFDLNNIRRSYTELANDPNYNRPLINRAINERYPPGSSVKPLILIAGLETASITADEVISCPALKAPKGWPSCWIYNRDNWNSHDNQWPDNKARNAIKGSCNIYFSRLASRIEPLALQQWLFRFGYGRNMLSPPPSVTQTKLSRNFRQLSGVISSSVPRGAILNFEQVPPLETNERRWFGIGQGNLRVTPLQVANAMAAIARGGIYKSPQLFLDDPNAPTLNLRNPPNEIDLEISPETLAVVLDGMGAVVSETGGTAYKEFAPVLPNYTAQGLKVYGKTGSTEKPDHAWFAGFATDGTNRSIAVAVVVEGGQHGSSDAAPIARDIIQFCIEAGYLGQIPNPEEI